MMILSSGEGVLFQFPMARVGVRGSLAPLFAEVDARQNALAWHPDPTRRHAQRYWNGAAWTEHVVLASGEQGQDPL
jgi:hypothetical protein